MVIAVIVGGGLQPLICRFLRRRSIMGYSWAYFQWHYSVSWLTKMQASSAHPLLHDATAMTSHHDEL